MCVGLRLAADKIERSRKENKRAKEFSRLVRARLASEDGDEADGGQWMKG